MTSCFNNTVWEMIWNAVDTATVVKHSKQSGKKKQYYKRKITRFDLIRVSATLLRLVLRPKCWIFNGPYFMNILSMVYKRQHTVKICVSINSVSHDIRQWAISTAILMKWPLGIHYIIPWYLWTGTVCQMFIFHRRSNLTFESIISTFTLLFLAFYQNVGVFVLCFKTECYLFSKDW